MASISKVDTIQDQDGNNIINESANTITIGASGDTITVPSGASMTGHNYPAFFGTLSTATSVPTGTFTKIQIDTMTYDTHSAFDTTNNRFIVPSGKAGKYLFRSGVYLGATLDDSYQSGVYYINGSKDNLSYSQQNITGNYSVVTNWSYIVDLSVGDYVEMYAVHNNGTTLTAQTAYTSFQGFRIGA